LRSSTLGLIDDCWRKGGTVFHSAVATWEIAQLASMGRIALDRPVEDWIERFLDHPGMEAVPLTHSAAMRAYRLHDLAHRDRGDRLLIATAIELACPLITYDVRITHFGEHHGRLYGFMVGA
jgi:PIN domain nuclease of toxin-antitoxin system